MKNKIIEFLDFKEDPKAINPKWNYVYSANHQPDSVRGKLYPGYYQPENRSKRIVSLLEEKDDFTIMLTSAGDKKINVIKEVRAATSLGLKEAKDLVEGAPKEVKTGVPKKEAEEIKAKLEAAGAKVELK